MTEKDCPLQPESELYRHTMKISGLQLKGNDEIYPWSAVVVLSKVPPAYLGRHIIKDDFRYYKES